ncbi:multiple epidermal growth factor-like domains protein 10 [Uloborus diversus]|uniref:multiple epidermal growth factor-like domains protein 10 n=1 Tax=Uloborus diversus TaxID=327109 RepID=UPI00240A8565|nr:multiple epidermal growth factor-like domains protein 10 [Uloborus diversus]
MCLCENDALCSHVDGSCACAPGWIGTFCETECAERTFGHDCNEICRCQNDGMCNPQNGSCVCPPGFIGLSCESFCADGYWGGNCSETCFCQNGARCNHVTGQCHCEPGYNGTLCEHNCTLGFYGVNCEEKCECQNHGHCDFRTGECLCVAGYIGIHCQTKCPAGSYGFNCSADCECDGKSTCHHETGLCHIEKKTEGWLEKEKFTDMLVSGLAILISICTAASFILCISMIITKVCLLKSTKVVDIDGVMKIEDSLWMGGEETGNFSEHLQNIKYARRPISADPVEKIELECKLESAVDDVSRLLSQGDDETQTNLCKEFKCKWSKMVTENRIMKKIVNETENICCIGYRMTDQKCKRCPYNYYGKECVSHCDCVNSDGCDHINGTCFCEPGWKGKRCNSPCKNGTYGLNCQQNCLCRNGATCDHIDGSCKCAPGWLGRRCDSTCLKETYGQDCTHICKCKNGGRCSHVDGRCTCRPGWIGTHCTSVPINSGRFSNKLFAEMPVSKSRRLQSRQEYLLESWFVRVFR